MQNKSSKMIIKEFNGEGKVTLFNVDKDVNMLMPLLLTIPVISTFSYSTY